MNRSAFLFNRDIQMDRLLIPNHRNVEQVFSLVSTYLSGNSNIYYYSDNLNRQSSFNNRPIHNEVVVKEIVEVFIYGVLLRIMHPDRITEENSNKLTILGASINNTNIISNAHMNKWITSLNRDSLNDIFAAIYSILGAVSTVSIDTDSYDRYYDAVNRIACSTINI